MSGTSVCVCGNTVVSYWTQGTQTAYQSIPGRIEAVIKPSKSATKILHMLCLLQSEHQSLLNTLPRPHSPRLFSPPFSPASSTPRLIAVVHEALHQADDQSTDRSMSGKESPVQDPRPCLNPPTLPSPPRTAQLRFFLTRQYTPHLQPPFRRKKAQSLHPQVYQPTTHLPTYTSPPRIPPNTKAKHKREARTQNRAVLQLRSHHRQGDTG